MIRMTCVAVMVALASLAFTTTTYASVDPNERVDQAVREYFRGTPVMVRIAKCESGFKHFDPDEPNGLNNNPSPSSSAAGIFQILLKTHGPKARGMGLDLRTVNGQLGYARYLYRHNGTRDWKATRKCWGG